MHLPEKLLVLKKKFLKCSLRKNDLLSPLEMSKKYDDTNWIENDWNSGCGKIQTLYAMPIG